MALRLRVLHHEQQLPSIGDHFHIQQPSFMDNRCVSVVPTNTPHAISATATWNTQQPETYSILS